MMQWLSSALSALLAAGTIRLLSSLDEELPAPKPWILGLIAMATGPVCWGILQVREDALTGYVVVFCAYLALTAYTDARIHKVYTLVNIAMLLGSLAVFVVHCVQAGQVDFITLGLAAVLFALGWFHVYGRGDGYVLAAITLFVESIYTDVLVMVLGIVLIGCICFIGFSVVDYFIKRKKQGKPQVKFWKQKRPLLPGIVAGFAVCVLFIP